MPNMEGAVKYDVELDGLPVFRAYAIMDPT